jgi:hypothetical protein
MVEKKMDIIGFTVPLWALFLAGIVIIFIAWKIIKFAIKLFVILLIFFGILMGLDMLGVFGWLQQLIMTLV